MEKCRRRRCAPFVLLLGCSSLPAKDVQLEELQTAQQVRQMPRELAARQNPVHLRGVVTFFDQKNFFRFLQDDTAGIYFFLGDSPDNPPLEAGQLVEMDGEVSPGEFAPIVIPSKIQILGAGTFPAAKPVTFEQLVSGQEDSQFVEVRGIVRAVHFDEESGYFLLEIATGGGRLTAYASKLPVTQSSDLVDYTATVSGVCVTRFNRQRQLFDIRLLVPRPTDLVVDPSEAGDPFALPAQSIVKLMQFTPQGFTAIASRLLARSFTGKMTTRCISKIRPKGFMLKPSSRTLALGDEVEVLGFPANGVYTPMLQDAVFKKIGTGPLPEPVPINTDEALKGNYDCRLVRMEATLLDRARHGREQFLVLETASGFIFHAYLDPKKGEPDFASLQNGSKVAVTGVCLIEPGNSWIAGEAWRAKSFRNHVAVGGRRFDSRKTAVVDSAETSVGGWPADRNRARGVHLGRRPAPTRPKTNPHHPPKIANRGRPERTI